MRSRLRRVAACLLPFLLLTPPIAAVASEDAIFRGQLRPRVVTTLAAGLAAPVATLAVHPGEAVRAGRVILTLNCRSEEAEAAVRLASLQLAERRYENHRRLAQLGDLSTIELEISKAEVAIAEAEYQHSQRTIEHCTVRAPFNGVIVERHVNPFQFVQRGDPLLQLVNPEELEIDMVVPSAWLPRLQPGARIALLVEDLQQELSAQVDRIVPMIDPVSQTIRIIARPERLTSNFLPGMSGSVVLR
jgi:membrane fusion protein, multidrug efflux system